jgi:hypothetical protein
MTTERSDTGTRVHLHRGELYRRGRKIRQLADILMDCTGPSCTDIPRAERLLSEIAAICGQGEDE